ncbi:MAG: DUF1376 domain-containing protein [Patescibacteria group bacterium]|nr:DUF1376 domain-containing protein [Patescibacteria group bacterium]
MPLFFGDFLASTVSWDGEEQALYLLLLAYQWTSGPLPSDPKRLARMARYDQKRFGELWEVVGSKFDQQPSGLVNSRLESHRQRAEEIASKRALNGRAGGLAKAARLPEQTPSNDLANARNLPEQKPAIQSNPIQSTPIQTNSESKAPKTGAVPRETNSDWFLDFKLAYPRRAGDQKWATAKRAANARIREGHTAEEMIGGAKRYAIFIEATGKAGTELVKQAATFLGPDKPFLESWSPPEAPTRVTQKPIERRLADTWRDLVATQRTNPDLLAMNANCTVAEASAFIASKSVSA